MQLDKSSHAFLSIPYGKTPQDKIYWKAVASAIKGAANLIEGVQLSIRTAEEQVRAFTIKDNVINLINDCDFTIAVISGKNPNVFWEIGYTEAQKKPVVYLVDKNMEELEESPVLISEALRCSYSIDDLKKAVENKEAPLELAVKLKSHLEYAINSAKASPKPPKLVALNSREECNLPTLVAGANVRIHLITSNLSYFSDVDNFTVKDAKKDKVFAFDPAVERGVEVMILTMDPESPIVKYRAEQLKFEYDVGSYRDELRESARRFYQRYKKEKNVSIRLYDDLPLQITMMVDDQVMTSVMSRGSRSRKNLHFLLDKSFPGAENFEQHFSEVGAGPCHHISTFKWAEQI
ncbi:MAG: hypothetical protein JOZ02_15780 [Acidobacteria bacterium]|nr:hypothetical protein [Acidobacteriota bacterium]